MGFLKKEAYTGSMNGMRYHVKKVEEEIQVHVYPQPYCYEATPEEQKKKAVFPFSEEGLHKTIDWLQEQYCENQELWEKSK